jgi:N-acyl-D-aspartate/D-glutamate deacylase
VLEFKITGGRLIDGTGAPARRGDVGVTGDAITAVGDLSAEPAGRTIDAIGRTVAPGFIDMHSHSDWRLWDNRRAESKIRQGVTTEVVGNCGFSPAPVSDQFRDEMQGFALAADGQLAIGKPHPRSYGTFPRVLGRYARDERVLSLEEAVFKMTGLPARRLGLRDRGVLAVGAKADVVVFDAATVADRATYENPHQYAAGIGHVLVNGRVVIAAGEHTGALPGRVLRPA